MTTACVSKNSSGVYHFLLFVLSVFAFPPFLSSSRESSALQQKEEEDEEEKERLLSLCESDPTAIHRLPVLSKTLQERRSRAVQDHRLAVSHGCITVEPAVGLCVCVTSSPSYPESNFLLCACMQYMLRYGCIDRNENLLWIPLKKTRSVIRSVTQSSESAVWITCKSSLTPQRQEGPSGSLTCSDTAFTVFLPTSPPLSSARGQGEGGERERMGGERAKVFWPDTTQTLRGIGEK